MAETWTSHVYEVLNPCGVCNRKCGTEEAHADAVLGREVDFLFGQRRIYPALKKGQEDHDGDRIQIVHDVVREAVSLHGACLRYKGTVHEIDGKHQSWERKTAWRK